MITREDINPLSAAIGSGAVIGLTLGLWLSLPSYLSQPIVKTDAQIASQIDPNLARYNEMIAANGVSATPYILATGYTPPSQAQQTFAEAAEPETTTFAMPSPNGAELTNPNAPTRIQVAAWNPTASEPPPAAAAPDDWDHLPTVGGAAQSAIEAQGSAQAPASR
jgi:hypothetical protein